MWVGLGLFFFGPWKRDQAQTSDCDRSVICHWAFSRPSCCCSPSPDGNGHFAGYNNCHPSSAQDVAWERISHKCACQWNRKQTYFMEGSFQPQQREIFGFWLLIRQMLLSTTQAGTWWWYEKLKRLRQETPVRGLPVSRLLWDQVSNIKTNSIQSLVRISVFLSNNARVRPLKQQPSACLRGDLKCFPLNKRRKKRPTHL